jgi:uncharacterized protein (TIGR02145 family)
MRFLYNETDKVYEDPFDKRYGFSVRCVRDDNIGKTAADGGKALKALSEPTASDSGTFTDRRDGNKYKTVVIGGVRWMAENLKYRIGESRRTAEDLDYRTGESWCYGKSNSNCYYDCYNRENYWLYQEAWEQWDSWETPRAHCPNNYANAFCEIHGRLYDWEAAKKACPPGWRLPSNQDWVDLVTAAGGEDAAGKPLKSKRGWRDFSRNNDKDTTDNENAARSWGGGYCQSGGGTNDYGFSALPGGGYWGGGWSGYGFGNAGGIGYWWTATEYDKVKAYLRIMRYDNNAVEEVDDRKDIGFSVRCRQEGSAAEEEQREREHQQREKVRQQLKVEKDAEIKAKKEKERNERIEKNTGYFTDSRDRRKYRTVKIGGQVWMAENLNYQPTSRCRKDDTGCVKYGRVYHWSAAMKACPSGWHLPSRREWDILAQTVGGRRAPAADGAIDWHGVSDKLKARSGWGDVDGKDANGTDDYGFSALPRRWWTATGKGSDAYGRSFFVGDDIMYEYYYAEGESNVISSDWREPSRHAYDGDGLSVRCVQDGGGKQSDSVARRMKKQTKEEERRIEKLSAYFTDSRDGRSYRTVEIGGKRWMAENLNYKPDWKSNCYGNDYDDGDGNGTSYCNKYGKLYDWNTAQTICPVGWRLPTREDWDSLARAAGGERRHLDNAWYGAGKRLKAANGWNEYNGEDGGGTDDDGFSALPGGSRFSRGEYFKGEGGRGVWWTASERGKSDAYYRDMYSRYDDEYEGFLNKGHGFSVRCVYKGISAEEQKEIDEARIKKEEEQKRLEKLSTYFTDSRDGKKYRAVKIGGKRWMAENLNYQPKTGKSWCYDGDTLYCGKYGRLYDFRTAKTACPAGWRLPSRAEWDSLGRAVGGWSDACCSGFRSWFGAEKKLKARDGWYMNIKYDVNHNGTDDYGFSALPGGSRYTYGFTHAGASGSWWADTKYGDGKTYHRYIHSESNSMQEYSDDIKGAGYSVRCVQDK